MQRSAIAALDSERPRAWGGGRPIHSGDCVGLRHRTPYRPRYAGALPLLCYLLYPNRHRRFTDVTFLALAHAHALDLDKAGRVRARA